MRGILQQEHQVGFTDVTWVTTRAEHVQTYTPQGPVEHKIGAKLDALLREGELDAIIGFGKQAEDAQVRRLFTDDAARAQRFFDTQGFMPLNHTLVVRDALLKAHPDLPQRLLARCRAARARFLKRLEAPPTDPNYSTDPIEARHLSERTIVNDRWLECGLEPNRAALTALLSHMEQQKILSQTPKLESIFAL